jgi:tetratricopeptide (TPR) repeat protein
VNLSRAGTVEPVSLAVFIKTRKTERRLYKKVLAGIVVSLFAQVAAAAVDPFYLDLYRRGMTQYAAGDFAAASRALRLAAFGFVDSVEQFETAHIYAAIAASKIGQTEDARRSAQHVLAAERVTRSYPRLALPAQVRAEFEVIAKTTLAANEYAFLTSNAPAPPRAGPQVNVRSTSPATPPAPAPGPAVVQSPPAVAPQPVAATQRAVTQAPQPVPPTQVAPPLVTPPPVTMPPAASTSETAATQVTGKARTDEAAPPPTKPASSTSASTPASTPHSAPQPSDPSPHPRGSLADAERAITAGDLAAARAIYSSQLEAPQLPHGDLLKIGEGLYRSRDFRGAVRAFVRAGTFAKGEESYRYYLAVSLYESGQYAAAKRELAAALPFVERTPDVERYRVKIEGAIE